MRPTGRPLGCPYCLHVINSRPGGVPAYVRLADLIRQDIAAGRLTPGQAIPSERTLGQTHGLGRHTIRKAISLLRSEGLVSVVRGHGVVVREHGDMQQLVPPPGSVVTARMPTGRERADLDLDDGTPVLSVQTPDGGVTAYPADRWQLRYPS